MTNEADVLDPEFNSKNWNLEQGITSVRKCRQLGSFEVISLLLSGLSKKGLLGAPTDNLMY